MQNNRYEAYFTVEAAVLYPIVLGVILLMIYLLFFQYDRCLLDQDMGKAAVAGGGRWMQTKEKLNHELQEREIAIDTEKYIAWERELPLWKLEKNFITVEQTGRLRYPFPGMGVTQKYWSAKSSFRVERNHPVDFLRTYRRAQKVKEELQENENVVESDSQ